MLPATPLIAHDDRVVFFVRALRMLHGQVPYRDFFELVTPGTDLLYMATLRILGVHAWILQAWSIVVGVSGCVILTESARRMFRGWTVLLPALLFLVFAFDGAPDPTHHWFSALAALAAVSVLLGGDGLGRTFVAGLLCAVATLFTQTQGALAFFAVILYLSWRKRDEKDRCPGLSAQLGALVLPYLLIVFCVSGYYIHQAGWHTMLFDLVEFPIKYLPSGKDSLERDYLRQFPAVRSAADLARFVPFVLIYAAVPYTYLFGLYRVWRIYKTQPAMEKQAPVLLCLVGLALFLAVASGPRFHRLCTVSPPAILTGVWLLSGPRAAARYSRSALWTLGIGFLMIMSVVRQTKRLPMLELPTGRVAFNDPLDYLETGWLAARTHPGDLFFNNPDLVFYLSLDNPTSWEWVTDTDFSRPEQVNTAVAELRVHPPKFIALARGSADPADGHNNSAPFRQFVQQNYRLAAIFPVYQNTRQEEIWELRTH